MIARLKLASFATVFASMCLVFDDRVGSAKELQADPTIQEHLQKLVPPIRDEKTIARSHEALQKLPADELLRQLLIFSANATTTEQGMIPAAVIWQLNLPTNVIPHALVDYLDTSSEVYRQEIEKWLTDAEQQNRRGPPNLDPYATILSARQKAGEALPTPLIRHMYSVDPSEALLSMQRVFAPNHTDDVQSATSSTKIKELLWNEHVISEAIWRKENNFGTEFLNVKADAISALHKLSIYKDWWARLFVAEILQRHPELRSQPLIDRLKKDDNELVRQAITASSE